GGCAAANAPAPPDAWRPPRQRRARAASVCGLRGVGRVGQGRSDQAARGTTGSATCPRRAVRGAHLGREAAPLPLAVLADSAGLGRNGRPGSLLVRTSSGR